jgi:hypothetical protein
MNHIQLGKVLPDRVPSPVVIPAHAGIQVSGCHSRACGNPGLRGLGDWRPGSGSCLRRKVPLTVRLGNKKAALSSGFDIYLRLRLSSWHTS